jgi:hypothetical protein
MLKARSMMMPMGRGALYVTNAQNSIEQSMFMVKKSSTHKIENSTGADQVALYKGFNVALGSKLEQISQINIL